MNEYYVTLEQAKRFYWAAKQKAEHDYEVRRIILQMDEYILKYAKDGCSFLEHTTIVSHQQVRDRVCNHYLERQFSIEATPSGDLPALRNTDVKFKVSGWANE